MPGDGEASGDPVGRPVRVFPDVPMAGERQDSGGAAEFVSVPVAKAGAPTLPQGVDVSAELSGGQKLRERLGEVIQKSRPAVRERRQWIAAWQEATLC